MIVSFFNMYLANLTTSPHVFLSKLYYYLVLARSLKSTMIKVRPFFNMWKQPMTIPSLIQLIKSYSCILTTARLGIQKVEPRDHIPVHATRSQPTIDNERRTGVAPVWVLLSTIETTICNSESDKQGLCRRLQRHLVSQFMLVSDKRSRSQVHWLWALDPNVWTTSDKQPINSL